MSLSKPIPKSVTAQYTIGPLEVRKDRWGQYCIWPDGSNMAIGGARFEADAQLWAAAPDLLAVAEGCLGFFDYMKAQGSEFTPDETWLRPLREAITKAGGKL